MTIEQLKTRKKQLEQEIREAVTKSVQEFIEDTGLSPESIDIETAMLTRLGGIKGELLVTKVTCPILI